MPYERPDVPSAATIAGDQELTENMRLRLEIARLEGQVHALQQRLSAQDAADEHHRVELELARSETANARAEMKAAQARAEEWRRLGSEARERQADAERQRDQAATERATIIAGLGRRGRKHLEQQKVVTDEP